MKIHGRDDMDFQQAATPHAWTVLVTGAGGFLGSTLVRRLVADDYKVRAAVRLLPNEPIPEVDYVVGDVGDAAYVEKITADVNIVFHAAATMKGSKQDFERGTVNGTHNIIQACLQNQVSRLVYVSSLSVLDHAGKRTSKVSEGWPFEPHPELRGLYTQTKLAAEQMVTQAAREQGLAAVVLRPGIIFGPGAKTSNLAGSLDLLGRWIMVGDGSLALPLVYVDDVVDAMLLAAIRPGVEGSIFHVVDPAVVTQAQLVTMQQAAGAGRKVWHLPESAASVLAGLVEMVGRVSGRSLPISRYRIRSLRPLSNFDQTSVRSQLGWEPKVGVEEGLRRTFAAEMHAT